VHGLELGRCLRLLDYGSSDAGRCFVGGGGGISDTIYITASSMYIHGPVWMEKQEPCVILDFFYIVLFYFAFFLPRRNDLTRPVVWQIRLVEYIRNR
jgi:hypothetical protein